MTKTIILAIVTILITSSITSTLAFADDDDKEKKVKTLASECAKKKPTNFDGLLCQAVLAINTTLDTLSAAVSDLQNSIVDINSRLSGIQNEDGTIVIEQSDVDQIGLEVKSVESAIAPPFAVTNSNEEGIFTVNPDGSIKIGANSITIHDNGTFSSTQPLDLPAGSKVGGQTISTGPHTVNTDTFTDLNCSVDQIARFDGTQWICSDEQGGSGSLEGDFTSYTRILNQDYATGSPNTPNAPLITNDGNTVFQTRASGFPVFIINKTGAVIHSAASSLVEAHHINSMISATGKYMVVTDRSAELIRVFKDGVALTTLPYNIGTDFADSTSISVAISPDGKFIVFVGENANEDATRVNIYEGS